MCEIGTLFLVALTSPKNILLIKTSLHKLLEILGVQRLSSACPWSLLITDLIDFSQALFTWPFSFRKGSIPLKSQPKIKFTMKRSRRIWHKQNFTFPNAIIYLILNECLINLLRFWVFTVVLRGGQGLLLALIPRTQAILNILNAWHTCIRRIFP